MLAPIWVLDSPSLFADPVPKGAALQIRGWFVPFAKTWTLEFVDKTLRTSVPIRFRRRRDVKAHYGKSGIGFEATCPEALLGERTHLQLSLRHGEQSHEIVVPVPRQEWSAQTSKREKLARVRHLLCCPLCKDALDEILSCSACKKTYGASERGFDFIDESLRSNLTLSKTDNVSDNQYDGQALNLIAKNQGGLVLDCGAGFRERSFANVVNLEIVDYESTDVLAAAEHLPFKDNSFDVVFSFAVLEHVKFPELAAKELVRVLKPGGTLYCQVPFLQPVHGYPHHYFNMTQSGLRSLFEGRIKVKDVNVLTFGHPIFSLSWIVASYGRGLSFWQKLRFFMTPIGFFRKGGNFHLGRSYVERLAPETYDELSCCNYLLGEKAEMD